MPTTLLRPHASRCLPDGCIAFARFSASKMMTRTPASRWAVVAAFVQASERAGGLSLSRGYCIILVLGHGAFSIGWCFKHSSEGKKAVRSPDKLYIWNLLYPHCLRLHHHTRRTDIIIIIIPSLKDDEDYSFFREINLLMRLVFCWISSRQPRKSFNLHYEFSSHLYFVVSLLTYLYTVFLFSCLTRQTEDG